MLCKEDVITWFKEAASYRRIDVMCTLLNMCIPFELRYLGTYIEEQGKHDYQELRGAALAANSVENLAREIPAPARTVLEKNTRNRLTVYISLLQSRNYSCANWLYESVLRADGLDAIASKDVNLQAELMLLFTLALNHPAFNFEQKLYFGDVVTRLTESEGPVQGHHNPPPCPPGLGYPVKPPPIPVHHMPIGMSKAPNPLNHPDAPMPPPGIPLPSVHGDYVSPQGIWTRTHHYLNTSCPPPDVTSFPPPISPLVSQHTSPTPSRPVSPTRIYTCRAHPTAMPVVTHMDRLQPPPSTALKEPLLIAAEEVSHINDTSDKNPTHQWMDSMVIGKIPNGLMPLPANCQMYLSGELQALSPDDAPPSQRCPSSSGSSNSSDCHSPPDTPTDSVLTLHGPGRGLAGNGKLRNGAGGTAPPPGLAGLAPADSAPPIPLYANNCTVPYTTHYTVPPPPPAATFPNRSLFYSQAYRPQFPAYQQNGELPYMFPPPYLPLLYSSATTTTAPTSTLPPPKVTCYNCGASGHMGSDCNDPTIEEITQKMGYQLEYTSSPPPPDVAPPSTATHDK